MIFLFSFLLVTGILIFFEYKNAKIRKQKELSFYKWQNQILTYLEKISNKY